MYFILKHIQLLKIVNFDWWAAFQRCALRIIEFKPFHSDVSYLFQNLNIPLFSNLVRMSNILFVFDSITNYLPSSISNFFIQCRHFYSYNTRNVENGKLVLPIFKGMKYGKSNTSSFFISARAMNLNILRILKVHIQQNIEYPKNGSEVAKTI